MDKLYLLLFRPETTFYVLISNKMFFLPSIIGYLETNDVVLAIVWAIIFISQFKESKAYLLLFIY